MLLSEVIELIEKGEIEKLKNAAQLSKYAYFISDTFDLHGDIKIHDTCKDLQEYHPKQHNVHDTVKRKDKLIKSEDERDSATVKVARLSIPEQQRIVMMASSFLGIPKLSATPYTALETDLFSIIKKIHIDNKIDYLFNEIKRITMSERECAEIWYSVDAEDGYWNGTVISDGKVKFKCKVVAPSKGDTLLPIFDNLGDMVAFGRYYETITSQTNNLSTEKRQHFDIYTKDESIFMVKIDKETIWQYLQNDKNYSTLRFGFPNLVGKIPVTYYMQPATEWHDVQEMIERLETKISNHADTNDYFDSPIVFAEGDVEGFSNKGEQGKVLQGKAGAKVSYLTWNNAPESMKMEIENLRKFISLYTHTPDFSFDNVKGMGNVSGVSLKMLFMDSHLKAQSKEEIFGQSIQRRINYLKAAVVSISPQMGTAKNINIRPIFNYFLPKDIAGEVTYIIQAYQAGIISLESAVTLNPLVSDAVAELEKIKAEKVALLTNFVQPIV